MRVVLPWTFAAALVAILPATVIAQDPGPPPSQPVPGATSQTPPTTSPTPTTTTTSTKSKTDESNGSGWFNATQSRWTAAGFVGANYGASTTSSSVDFGGQVGYLYRGIIGGSSRTSHRVSTSRTRSSRTDRT
jgi:hypothetical protein